MTAKSAKRWLAISAIMIILAMIFLLLPVDVEKDGSKNDFIAIEPGDSILTVTEIIDGDTFVLSDGSRARLIGVDTPADVLKVEAMMNQRGRGITS